MSASHPDPMTTAIADIALILLVGAMLAKLARRTRIPPVVAEILAGITLGPSLLGLLPGDPSRHFFPAQARPLLSAVAQVGILLFMFLIGWEFDRDMVRGRRRGSVLSVALASMAVPFAGGVALAFALYPRHERVGGHLVGHTAFVLYLGVAMAITAFPVLARFLADTRMRGTRVGELALAGAAAADALAWCMLAAVVAIVSASGLGGLPTMAGELVAYAVIMIALVRPALTRLVRRWGGNGGSPFLLAPIAAGVLLSAAATSWIGVQAIFGAFAFGCVMPREPVAPLARHVRVPLEHVSGLLLPVFFIVVGLSVDIGSLSAGDLADAAAIVAVACASKLLGAGAAGRITGLGWRDAGLLGVLMNMRGLTELIVLSAGMSMGVLDGHMYTVMVLMALVTTSAAGLLVPYRPPEAGWTWTEDDAGLQIVESGRTA